MVEIDLNRSISDSCAKPSRSIDSKVDSVEIERSEDLGYDRTYVVNLSIGYSGAEQSDEFSPKDCSTYSEEEWNELSKEEKETWLDNYLGIGQMNISNIPGRRKMSDSELKQLNFRFVSSGNGVAVKQGDRVVADIVEPFGDAVVVSDRPELREELKERWKSHLKGCFEMGESLMNGVRQGIVVSACDGPSEYIDPTMIRMSELSRIAKESELRLWDVIEAYEKMKNEENERSLHSKGNDSREAIENYVMSIAEELKLPIVNDQVTLLRSIYTAIGELQRRVSYLAMGGKER